MRKDTLKHNQLKREVSRSKNTRKNKNISQEDDWEEEIDADDDDEACSTEPLKRSNKILIWFIAILFLASTVTLWMYQDMKRERETMNALIEPMIKDLSVQFWSKEALDKYATPNLHNWLVDNNFSNGLVNLNLLGQMEEYKGIVSYYASSNTATLISWIHFDSGDAFFSLQLMKKDGVWRLNNLSVKSPALLQTVSRRKSG